METLNDALRVKCYYEDTDGGGLVHHSNYLKYFERGREHILNQERLVKLYQEKGISFVVTSVAVHFKQSARHGDDLIVKTVPSVTSDYRIRFAQNVYRTSDNEEEKDNVLLVIGDVEMVAVGPTLSLCKLPQTSFPELFRLAEGKDHDVSPRKIPRPPRKSPDHTLIKNSDYDMTCYLDDTDFTGVCYYANYLRWMERARAEILSVEMLASMRRDVGVGAAIHRAEIKYKQGARFGDRVVVKTQTCLASQYRVIFKHEIYRKEKKIAASETSQQETLLVRAEISIVCLDDGGAGKLVKIPSLFFRRIREDSVS
eukprot:g2561.t1